jgi:hypothetical protein
MPLGCTGRTLQYDHEPSLYFGDCCPVRLAYWRPCVDRNYLVDAASCGHAPGAPTLVGGIEAAGERRYLTVILCDLVGSTGMAAKLDAEEWRDLSMPGRRRVTPAWDDGVAATGADPIGTGEPFAAALPSTIRTCWPSVINSSLAHRER